MLSFTPGFNRVTKKPPLFRLAEPFQRFPSSPQEKPLKRLGKINGITPVTRLKPGENETAVYFFLER